MDALLEARDLAKSFMVRRNLLGRPVERFHAVRGVDLTVRPGETLALVGESGAGKSTVGRLLLRLIEPDRGSITFAGHDVRALGREGLRHLRARMQMVFQDPYSSFDPKMTVGASVGEPLLVHDGASSSVREAKAIELLERVGLRDDHYDRYPYELSGGQLQRVAVARAIATEPDLVVCDEPVAALDVSVRAQVLNLLQDIQHERGIAYVFISHDLSLVRVLAHRVAVMYAGRVVESGAPEALFTDPRHPYTRTLIDAVPVADPDQRRLRDLAVVEVGDDRPADGCAFAPRCALATDECAATDPVLSGSNGTAVACHHAPARSDAS